MNKKHVIKDIIRALWGWLWFIPLGHFIMYIPWYDAIIGGFITTWLFMPIYSLYEILWHNITKKKVKKDGTNTSTGKESS